MMWVCPECLIPNEGNWDDPEPRVCKYCEMKIEISVEVKIGQVVYHKADPELKGIVVGYVVRKPASHHIIYLVSWGVEEGCHDAHELSTEPVRDFE